MTIEKIQLSPRSIIFWRHIVGIIIILLAQHPRLFETMATFLGLWAGSLVIALGGAGLITCLAYLFITSRVKERAWRLFVLLAWCLAILQLAGQWLIPTLVGKIASTPETSVPVSATATATVPTPTSAPAPAPQFSTTRQHASEGWTQIDIRKADNKIPVGTRFCVTSDGQIILLYPPGVKPKAEEANPYCFNHSEEFPK
jgi:hypothetical protein